MLVGYKPYDTSSMIDKNSRIRIRKIQYTLSFVEKSSGGNSERMICSFSTTYEPIYNKLILQQNIPEVLSITCLNLCFY